LTPGFTLGYPLTESYCRYRGHPYSHILNLAYFPNNTKQYLTNLVSVDITWYRQNIKFCHQYDSSIVKLSSRYSYDGFGLPGIVTVLILAIFAKPSMLILD